MTTCACCGRKTKTRLCARCERGYYLNGGGQPHRTGCNGSSEYCDTACAACVAWHNARIQERLAHA